MKKEIKSIQVLGSDCPNCRELYNRVVVATNELGIKTEVEHINDIKRIIEIGVMSAPVLMINDEVVLTGKLPSVSDLKDLFEAQLSSSDHHNCEGCSGNCHC
jgi:small redox-active disulfide protein 2